MAVDYGDGITRDPAATISPEATARIEAERARNPRSADVEICGRCRDTREAAECRSKSGDA